MLHSIIKTIIVLSFSISFFSNAHIKIMNKEEATKLCKSQEETNPADAQKMTKHFCDCFLKTVDYDKISSLNDSKKLNEYIAETIANCSK